MRDSQDTARKRALLATARTRFASEIQPLKQNALDKIVTNILYTAASDQWVNAQHVQSAFRKDSGGYVLNESDIQSSLRRLKAKHSIEAHPTQSFRLFRLTAQERKRVELIQSEAQQRFDSVLRQLFGSDARGFRRYGDCLLDILSSIFGQLGEESARLVSRTVSDQEVLSTISISQSLQEASKSYPDLDHGLVRSAVDKFFREDDPKFSEIKWNLAQNLFIAKAVGLDPSGALLSRELFEGAVFYLDTNVIISGLEPTHRSHGWFHSLVASAQLLSVELRVCSVSLAELDAWLAPQRALFDKVGAEIPGVIAPKVDSLFLQKYEKARQNGGELSTDEVFASFANPKETLTETYGIVVEDDPWFETANADGRLDGFATKLQARSQPVRGQPKRIGAARHDAKVLTWIERQRSDSSTGVWFITTDRSLPGAVPTESETASLAITVATLLQWISPMMEAAGGTVDFTLGFAQMIRERLLPRERFFELQDFLVFHEMHISIKDLPAEDVERTLREIKANASHLDPSNPEDLQQISLIVARNLVDPGSKYKQELARLESDQERERAEHAQRLLNAEDGTKAAIAAMELAEERHQGEVVALRASLEDMKKQAETNKLLRGARIGIVLTVGVLVISELLVLYFSNQYAEGTNQFQKISTSWQYFGFVAAVVLFLGGWIIGKDRLAVLDWPFSKLFKAE